MAAPEGPFHSVSDGIESACDAGDPGLIPGSGRSPGGGEWLLTLVFLPGETHKQRSLVGYSPWGCKQSDTAEQLTLSTSGDHREEEKKREKKSHCSMRTSLSQMNKLCSSTLVFSHFSPNQFSYHPRLVTTAGDLRKIYPLIHFDIWQN